MSCLVCLVFFIVFMLCFGMLFYGDFVVGLFVWGVAGCVGLF